MDIKEIRQQFPFIIDNPNVSYFDNTATSLKPFSVINAEVEYLSKIVANPHTNDYDFAYQANEILESTRKKVASFINAKNPDEIVFTSGTTASLNQVAFGLEELINEGDEIFITALEHASDMLPWIVVAKNRKAIVKEIPLKEDLTIDEKKLSKMISSKTKVVAFAAISNTIAAKNDVQKIIKKVKQANDKAIVSVDCAQSIGHFKTDIQKWKADFISFSAHKMYGPFGIGVLWGKKELLDQMKPLFYGGGMSESISIKNMEYDLSSTPEKFEGGTPNISGIYGLNFAIDFINNIGIDNIAIHEKELKKYAISQVEKHNLTNKIEFYNLGNDSPILLFNVKGINPQDIAAYLATDYSIDTRSGAHCARTISEVIDTKITVRASFAIYNTFEEIDRLITALSKSENFLDHLFR